VVVRRPARIERAASREGEGAGYPEVPVEPVEPPMFGQFAFVAGVFVAGVVVDGVDVDAVRLAELLDMVDEVPAA
jgi:hypothetical protein